MLELEQEKKKLALVIKEFEKALKRTTQKVENVYKTYQNDDWIAEEAKEEMKFKLKNLYAGKNHPYFARIDFIEEKQNKENFYIGKIGLINEKEQIVVTDWRAPIASVYYDHGVGKAFYAAPKGNIHGELLLKRQYEIEKSELISYRDVDSVSQDEILKPYLSANADSRLKSIVASIQSEQNTIIRKPIQRNMVVQGVAGSGKTTVALHRIAYLVYQHKDTIYSRDFMVIGPNSFFVNYISSVLPDLDVYDVSQNDFLSFTSKYLKQKWHLLKGETENSSYKTSLVCQKEIDAFLKEREETYMENHSFVIWGIPILSASLIKKVYQELCLKNYDFASQKWERLLLLLSKHIQNHKQEIWTQLSRKYYQELAILSKDVLVLKKKELSKIETELEKGLKSRLRKHFSLFVEQPQILYSQFLLKKKGISEKEAKDIKNKKYRIEDLPGLLYLKYKMQGSGYYENYKHIVLDEAQDYNDFHFYALKKIFKSATFSIFGDLAQSLFPSRSIQSWDSVLQTSFNQNTDLIYLEKSYRTTIEIMVEANKINKYLHLKQAVPVIRHGKNVIYEKTNTPYETIYTLLQELQTKYESIAIIHKEENEVQKAYKYLKTKGISLTHIHENEDTYTGGVCILTSTLSKGLEFDAVIIMDVSEEAFHTADVLDMKLLYVSMTRALHELYLLYPSKVAKVLQDDASIVEINQ
ncbi:MAG: ATP-binding domain-containing protein [Bacilli bacterium]|nr:ATP-binding domain-containing protein [Bacilli bacterium]